MMDAGRMLCLAVIFCFVGRSASGKINITIDPKELVLTPDDLKTGGHVTVMCNITSLAADESVFIISVKRTVDDSPETTVASLTFSDDKLVVPETIPGASVVGSTSIQAVVLTMTKATCKDAGNYYCEAIFFSAGSGSSKTEHDDKDLDVEVTPGNITLTPDPKGVTAWTVNATLVMHCNGPVGLVKDGVKVAWKWQYMNQGGPWTEYTQDSDIQNSTGAKQECYEQWESSLTRELKLEDNNREYRCFICHDQKCYTELAATHFVGTVTEEPLTTLPPSSPDTKKGDIGPIIGGVVAALVVIIVIIVIVVVVVRRKSNKGDTYAAENSDSKPNEDPSITPYTVSPGVTYSQPNRFRNDREPQGVANKAMDEAADKPSPRENRPPRYANDFHQGRPNRGYEYEPDGRTGRRYSSDEDGGTNSQVNTSQHSFGHGDPSIGTPI